ncbi:MAG: dihydrolipoyl dehydrogenase [Ruminococcaceae bacterium]|nr:dihydrolipoyl dehydrogenase [Oscillospiraceae bacterium]
MVYDLIVLGGGPAGYLAGERAGQAGLKALVIEKRAFGGVCLNEGCVPSKSLLYSAKVFDYANHGEKYGVTTTGASIDQKKVIDRKNKVVNTLVSGIEMTLKSHKVEMVKAIGKITGRSAEGYTVEADGNTYTAKHLIIATGSSAVVPPIPGVKEGVESGMVMTNREVLDLTEIPKNLVVIGGGVIGLEMASYYNSVGANVTVVEMLPKIAGPTDEDISDILLKNYKAKGITFHLGAKVTEVKKDAVVFEKDGKTESVPADKVLLSIGRRAVSADIGLETIGVEVNRGAIVTDRYMKTNVPGVYAAGDVNGKSMLAHTAYREAEVAVNNIIGKKDIMRYDAIPAVIYTNPEVGSCGETERTAKEKGYDIEVVKLPMAYSGRYVAENEGGNGIIKLVVDKKYRRLLGCHVLSNYASEFIIAAVMMIESQWKIDDIKEFVFPHPTVCEIIREALFQVKA